MKAVMYHYVRAYDPRHPNFRFLDIADFRAQLDYFEQEYGFVTRDAWSGFVSGQGAEPARGKIILTFDDAMHCHYDDVFPELQKRGLWGIFYVPTQPYSTGKMLDVHRIHLLCGAFDGQDLLAALNALITDDMIPDSKRSAFREQTYAKQENYAGVDGFKRTLNYFIDYRFKEQVIDQIAAQFGYRFDAASFYVSPSQLVEMQQAGHVIGSHTVSHPVMSKLPRDAQESEITNSFQTLAGMGLKELQTYCHPYGGFHSFDQNTCDLLAQAGVTYAFNVQSRDITAEDITTSRYFLPRYDCNEFPHGKAS